MDARSDISFHSHNNAPSDLILNEKLRRTQNALAKSSDPLARSHRTAAFRTYWAASVCLILFLLSTISPASASGPTFTVGALIPQTTSPLSTTSLQAAAATLLAFEKIELNALVQFNNESLSGYHLPNKNFTLFLSLNDTRDLPGVALDLARTLLSDSIAILADGCVDPLNAISYSATVASRPALTWRVLSNAFSSTVLHPYLAQLTSNAASEARAITTIVRQFNFKNVVILASSDIPTTELLAYLQLQLSRQSVLVHAVELFPANDSSSGGLNIQQCVSAIAALQDEVRVVIFLTSIVPDAQFALATANSQGIAGPGSGFSWIGSDRLMDGLFSLNPRLTSAQWNSLSVAATGLVGILPHAPPSASRSWLEEQWATKINDFSTRFGVSSDYFVNISSSAFEAFDASWALAHAVHSLTNAAGDPSDGSQLLAALSAVNFSGATGSVRIGATRVPVFDVGNFQRSPSGAAVRIAQWTDDVSSSTTGSISMYSGQNFVWSTLSSVPFPDQPSDSTPVYKSFYFIFGLSVGGAVLLVLMVVLYFVARAYCRHEHEDAQLQKQSSDNVVAPQNLDRLIQSPLDRMIEHASKVHAYLDETSSCCSFRAYLRCFGCDRQLQNDLSVLDELIHQLRTTSTTDLHMPEALRANINNGVLTVDEDVKRWLMQEFSLQVDPGANRNPLALAGQNELVSPADRDDEPEHIPPQARRGKSSSLDLSSNTNLSSGHSSAATIHEEQLLQDENAHPTDADPADEHDLTRWHTDRASVGSLTDFALQERYGAGARPDQTPSTGLYSSDVTNTPGTDLHSPSSIELHTLHRTETAISDDGAAIPMPPEMSAPPPLHSQKSGSALLHAQLQVAYQNAASSSSSDSVRTGLTPPVPTRAPSNQTGSGAGRRHSTSSQFPIPTKIAEEDEEHDGTSASGSSGSGHGTPSVPSRRVPVPTKQISAGSSFDPESPSPPALAEESRVATRLSSMPLMSSAPASLRGSAHTTPESSETRSIQLDLRSPSDKRAASSAASASPAVTSSPSSSPSTQRKQKAAVPRVQLPPIQNFPTSLHALTPSFPTPSPRSDSARAAPPSSSSDANTDPSDSATAPAAALNARRSAFARAHTYPAQPGSTSTTTDAVAELKSETPPWPPSDTPPTSSREQLARPVPAPSRTLFATADQTLEISAVVAAAASRTHRGGAGLNARRGRFTFADGESGSFGDGSEAEAEALASEEIKRTEHAYRAQIAMISLDLDLAKSHLWDFDIFRFHRTKSPASRPSVTLTYIGFHLLNQFHVISRLKLDPYMVMSCLETIEAGYHPENPFHNAIHGADVAQSCCYFLLQTRLHMILKPYQLLGVIIAALIHDYDHPGVNNSFLVASQHPLAMIYNDQSVLESHHVSRALTALSRPNCNIFASLKAPRRTVVRGLIINLVLATDLKSHYEVVNDFKRRSAIQTAPFLPIPARVSDTHHTPAIDLFSSVRELPAARRHNTFRDTELKGDLTRSPNKEIDLDNLQVTLKMAIKCADLGHPAKPWFLHEEWATRIRDENFMQGDRERLLKLPVSPFMDRERDAANFAKNQIGFFEFLLTPMWEAWTKHFTELAPLKQLMDNNKNTWLARSQQEAATLNQVVVAPSNPTGPGSTPPKNANAAGINSSVSTASLVSGAANSVPVNRRATYQPASETAPVGIRRLLTLHNRSPTANNLNTPLTASPAMNPPSPGPAASPRNPARMTGGMLHLPPAATQQNPATANSLPMMTRSPSPPTVTRSPSPPVGMRSPSPSLPNTRLPPPPVIANRSTTEPFNPHLSPTASDTSSTSAGTDKPAASRAPSSESPRLTAALNSRPVSVSMASPTPLTASFNLPPPGLAPPPRHQPRVHSADFDSVDTEQSVSFTRLPLLVEPSVSSNEQRNRNSSFSSVAPQQNRDEN